MHPCIHLGTDRLFSLLPIPSLDPSLREFSHSIHHFQNSTLATQPYSKYIKVHITDISASETPRPMKFHNKSAGSSTSGYG